MRKLNFMLFLAAAAILAAACGDAGTGNTSNRPANAANAANNAAASTASVNHEAEIKKIMAELASELAANDAEAAAKHYADDYHLITPQGVDQTKAARTADMKSGASKFESFAYENISVRSYGDTAVAIADVKAKGTAAGQPVASNIKATLVFHKTKDGWKVVSGQATPVTAAASTAPSNTAASNSNAAANTSKPPPANN